MMDRLSKSHRRRVLALTFPVVGFKMVTGTTKSEVKIIFLFQLMLNP